MTTLREWLIRLWSTIRPRRRDADLEQELRLHLELAAEAEAEPEAKTRPLGSPSASARSVAVRAGGVAQAMDALRDQRGWPWLRDLVRDARYGLRALRRNPTFAAVALATLAIGIGANTAVFTVVDAVLIKPLWYPKPEELVAVWQTAPGAPGLASVSGELRLSASMFFTYADHNRTFQSIGVWEVDTATVTGVSEPEQVRTLVVSNGTLQALGVAPVLGRSLDQSDQVVGGPHTTMLSYGYWQRRFGGADDVLGRRILVDGVSSEIVGVLPAGFRVASDDGDLVLPVRFDRSKVMLPGFGYQGVARLKPGVTLQQADADIARMVPLWMTSWPMVAGVDPRVYEGWHIAPALRPLKQDVVGNVTDVLWVLMGTIGIVMLMACANVANLLLVRADARQQELAVRAALGAGRGRIVRGLLVESVLLALMGGLLGLGLAEAGLHWLLALGPSNLPRLQEISLDLRALVFAFGVSCLAGLAFGLMPALRSAGPRIAARLRSSGRSSSESRERSRTRQILVVAEVALAFVLLVSSGLMIRTFQTLRTVAPGFADPPHVQTVRVSIPDALVPDPDRTLALQHDIVDRLAAIPGVTSVGFATEIPMEGADHNWDDLMQEGRMYKVGETPAFRLFKGVSPGYFQAIGTRLLAGRDYTWTDLSARRPYVIISDNLAREFWGTPQAALGKRVRTLDLAPWREVIGVVEDTHDNGVDRPAPAIAYWPSFGESLYRSDHTNVERDTALVIRTDRAGTASLLGEVRKAVWSANASLPVAVVRTMQDIYDHSMARTSFALVMLAIAATMGLILGVVGVYGVISCSVSQRTREMGIRLALGADHRTLKGMFMRDGLGLVGAGVVIGMAASAALARLMASLLFGIRPLDPTTYVVVPLVLVLTTLLASYLPARRAAGVDPVGALKAE
jgi:putative ABC transport system permease protein